MSTLAFVFLLITTVPIVLLALMLVFGGPSFPVEEDADSTFVREESRRADAPIKTTRARDGTSLAYREYSSREEGIGATVLLLHGLSATSVSLDPLARYLSSRGLHVICPDIRGHGESGEHGRIGYIGQLEDDLSDLISVLDIGGEVKLVGFSAGGGLALRFGGSKNQSEFAHYVLLAPFISHDAPTYREGGGSAKVGLPRSIALMILNKIGIKAFNTLSVLKVLPERTDLYTPTTDYSFALMFNFRPQLDYIKNLSSIKQPISVLVGSEDEIFHAKMFTAVFEEAGLKDAVKIVPGLDHEGMIYEIEAHELVFRQLTQ